MSNSKVVAESVPPSGFMGRLKSSLAEKVLPRLNLTTYNRLQATRVLLDNSQTNVEQLQQAVNELRDIKANLEQQKIDMEQLKFNLTNELVALHMKNNPRQIGQPIADNAEVSTTEALERVRQVQALVQNDYLPLEVLAVLDCIPESHDAIYRYILRPLFERRVTKEMATFWDIRMSLNALSRILKPRNYLEIGTRVGWSMAQVMAYTPQTRVYSFDIWVEKYGNVENPGPEFVRNAMRKITSPTEPNMTFINGNSHNTLPQFFQPERYTPGFQLAGPRPSAFDLVTVDGDHNLEGAWMDLIAVLPHIAVGGAIVFDDLDITLDSPAIELHSETQYPDFYRPMPSGFHSLRDVWNAIKELYPNFTFIETGTQTIAVGIGIRTS